MSTYKKRNVRAKPRPKPVYTARPRAAPRTARAPRAPRATPSTGKFLGMDRPDSLGANIGSWIGHGAQHLLKAVTGFGDYKVENNTILQGGMSPPQIVNAANNGGIIIRHREFIADIAATTAFTTRSYDINPGLSSSFPWLAQIAQSFELYRLRGMIYEFKSMSSDAVLSTATSSALGTVIMATQYNSLNNAFGSKIQMENHEFANSSKPSCDFLHPIECKKSLIPSSELYTRDGAVPDNADQRLYDLGKFTIATQGQQAAGGTLGELWCTYEVEFYQQKYVAPFVVKTDHLRNTGCSNTQWLGNVHEFATGNSLGLSVELNRLTFPNNIQDGNYLLTMNFVAGSTGIWNPPGLTIGPDVSYGEVLQYWYQDSETYAGAPSTGVLSSARFSYAVIIKCLKAGLTLTFSGGLIPAASESDVWCTQIDQDITN